MTCYLNSLLQALYMTPEFRNALYKWKFDFNANIDESKSIPFQLQKLFLNLQVFYYNYAIRHYFKNILVFYRLHRGIVLKLQNLRVVLVGILVKHGSNMMFKNFVE